MNRLLRQSTRRILIALCLIVMMYAMQSCGVVGPPLPPEDIGIEAKIRSQQQAEEKSSEDSEKQIPLDQKDVTLPPLNPLGAQ